MGFWITAVVKNLKIQEGEFKGGPGEVVSPKLRGSSRGKQSQKLQNGGGGGVESNGPFLKVRGGQNKRTVGENERSALKTHIGGGDKFCRADT